VYSQILKKGAAGFSDYFTIFHIKSIRKREIRDAQKAVTAKIAKIGTFIEEKSDKNYENVTRRDKKYEKVTRND